MPSLLRAALLSAALGSAACASSAPAESVAAPAPPVSPSSPLPPSDVAARTPAGAATCDQASSFVLIEDGRTLHRYTGGRPLGTRGSDHAFAEVVIHENGMHVLHFEAIGPAPGYGSISVSSFPIDLRTLPGKAENTSIEFNRPFTKLEREELGAHPTVLTISRFGEVGDVIEGAVGPIPLRSRAGETTTATIRFRVCRAADWTVNH